VTGDGNLQQENAMQIQVETDHNIEGRDALVAQVRGMLESSLRRIGDRITHVAVHLTDQNSDKEDGDDDMRCAIEAHLEGRQRIAVTHQAATVEQAVDGAADKLARLIESTLGRARHQEDRRSDPPLAGPTGTVQS